MNRENGLSENNNSVALPEIMDIKELAKYLGIGKSKIYSLIRQKKIPASRIGRQYRFSKSVIEAWLKEKLITRKEESQIPLFQKESGNLPDNEEKKP